MQPAHLDVTSSPALSSSPGREVGSSARCRLSGRVWLVFLIVRSELLDLASQFIVDVRTGVDDELLERAVSVGGGLLLIRPRRIPKRRVRDRRLPRRWRRTPSASDEESRVTFIQICGSLSTRRVVVLNFGKHSTETARGARAVEFYLCLELQVCIRYIHIRWNSVEQAPVPVEVLRQAVTLTIPLFGEHLLCGLNVLHSEW